MASSRPEPFLPLGITNITVPVQQSRFIETDPGKNTDATPLRHVSPSNFAVIARPGKRADFRNSFSKSGKMLMRHGGPFALYAGQAYIWPVNK
jgi:hypothetical protein